MCIIIYRPEKAKGTVSRKTLISLAAQHNDGYGVMWRVGKKLRTWRGDDGRRKEWIDRILYLQAQNLTFAAHGRQATHGSVDKSMCHPFWIKPNYSALMHNGILPMLKSPVVKPSWSDTKAFVDGVLKRLPEDWYEHDHYRYLVRQAASGNRLLIMFNDKPTLIINASLGVWEEDIWYSNSTFRGYSSHKGTYTPSWDRWKEGKSYTSYRKVGDAWLPDTAPASASRSVTDSDVKVVELSIIPASDERALRAVMLDGRYYELIRYDDVVLCLDCAEKELLSEEIYTSTGINLGACDLCGATNSKFAKTSNTGSA